MTQTIEYITSRRVNDDVQVRPRIGAWDIKPGIWADDTDHVGLSEPAKMSGRPAQRQRVPSHRKVDVGWVAGSGWSRDHGDAAVIANLLVHPRPTPGAGP